MFLVETVKTPVFKGTSLLFLTNPSADVPFVWCYEERRYAERLEICTGQLSDSSTATLGSLSLVFYLSV